MSNTCCTSKPANNFEIEKMTCVDCGTLGCARHTGQYPAFCATSSMSEGETSRLREDYKSDAETYAFMKAASKTTSRGFSEALCRAEETMDYCHRMGYQKIGIAFCAGVTEEARALAKILRVHGYDVEGYVCKIGAMSNADMGLTESCCNFGTVSCNPLAQAEYLNAAKTDINIVMGLCVGHDAYFYRHSDAPCTTLLVKDKATVNNPGAALIASQTSALWSRMMYPDDSFCAAE